MQRNADRTLRRASEEEGSDSAGACTGGGHGCTSSCTATTPSSTGTGELRSPSPGVDGFKRRFNYEAKCCPVFCGPLPFNLKITYCWNQYFTENKLSPLGAGSCYCDRNENSKVGKEKERKN